MPAPCTQVPATSTTHLPLPSGMAAAARASAASSLLLPARSAVTPRAAAAAEPTRDRNWSLRATKSVSLLICGRGGAWKLAGGSFLLVQRVVQ